jgi:hypothetical protein
MWSLQVLFVYEQSKKPEPPPPVPIPEDEEVNAASEDGPAAPPPPIATRPEKTKSIYTKPVEEDKNKTPAVGQKQERPKKKKMTDEEILEKLRTIVSIGDPNRKYVKKDKIGQG